METTISPHMQQPPQELRAILFDLDNVLVFSEEVHFRAWQMVMVQLGVSPLLLHFQSLIGIDDLTQSRILKEQFNIEEEVATIWQMKREAFFTLIPQGFSAPHGRDLFLQKATHFTRAVVSSSGQEVIKAVLKSENITDKFDFIIGHEDCASHKPNPEPYLLALEKANLKPHQALVIEDSPSGITAALRAHIPVVGIFKDQQPQDLIENVRYFKTFSEVQDWLFQTHQQHKTAC